MNIIFLDIDGVLNCRYTKERIQGNFLGIDKNLLRIFKEIVSRIDVNIVLSSTWRLDEESRDEIINSGVGFIDVTPESSAGGFRGDEINRWLSNNRHLNISKWCILDDLSNFYPEQKLFQTSMDTGITEEIKDDVINYFLC